MRLSSFAFEERHHQTDLFEQYLILRRKTFVDALGWPLQTDGHTEKDQYDNPCARYVLLSQGDTLLAGARLLPDSAQWKGWRHMAADVRDGKLKTLDRTIICPKLDFDGVWECSRLLVNTDHVPSAQRAAVFEHLTHGIVQTLNQAHAKSAISISPPPLRRVLTKLGYCVEPAGPQFTDPYDGRSYRAIRMVNLARESFAPGSIPSASPMPIKSRDC